MLLQLAALPSYLVADATRAEHRVAVAASCQRSALPSCSYNVPDVTRAEQHVAVAAIQLPCQGLQGTLPCMAGRQH